MGFYSIYKIFKDIFRTIFGFKALRFIFIIFIIIFIFMFNSHIFAVSDWSLNTSFFTDSDINNAKNKANSIISGVWDNNDFDIFLGFRYDSAQKFVYFKNISSYLSAYDSPCYVMSDDRYFNPQRINFGIFNNGSRTDLDSVGGLYEIYTNNSLNTGGGWFTVSTTYSGYSINLLPIRTHFDIVDTDGNTIFLKNAYFPLGFITATNDISNWSFDNLVLYTGSYVYNSSDYFGLSYDYQGNYYNIDLSNYYSYGGSYFVIPKNQLTNSINLKDNTNITFYFDFRSYGNVQHINLGSYNLSLSNSSEINADSDKQVQGAILDETKNISDKLTDSNIDDDIASSLPTDNTVDPTADGVNGIFTSIYNAFCTGTAQDIVFPFPFTDKNITLPSNYVYDNLNTSGSGWVITIIQAFWWYIISRFIIKDIMNKINKIKSGDIEDIETTNIRGDML